MSEIIIEDKDIKMNFGMDCSLFMNDIGWRPEYDISDSIESLLEYYATIS